MIDALVTGKLRAVPTYQVSPDEDEIVVTAELLVQAGERSLICNAVAFNHDAQDALRMLGAGEGVALAGTLKVHVRRALDGTIRPSLDLEVAQVLTSHHVTKQRRTTPPERESGPQSLPRRHDDSADDLGPVF